MADEQAAHRRAVELAIVMLDFELESAERAWLADHLRGCGACRADAERYAVDARAIESLPLVSAPEHVEARVLRPGRDRPRGPSGPLRLVAVVTSAALVVAVGGLALLQSRGLDTGPGGSTTPSTSVVSGLPSASASSTGAVTPASTATPTPVASATGPPPAASHPPAPSGPATNPVPIRWEPVAVPEDARAREIRTIAVRGGRSVATLVGTAREPRLWWSDNGGRWRDAELPGDTFGGTTPWLVEPFANGFVALAWADVDRSVDERRIWLSPDGLAWRPNVDATGTLARMTLGVLAVSETSILVAGQSRSGEILAWRSADGVAWEPVAVEDEIREADLEGMASDGSAFFAFGTSGGSPAIWRSDDGAAWERLSAPQDLVRIEGLAAVGAGLVAYGPGQTDGYPDVARWSADGSRWEPVAAGPSASAPGDRIIRLGRAGDGLLAVWRLGNGMTLYSESTDGRSWTVRDAGVLPDGVELVHAARAGPLLVGLGWDADGRVVAFSAAVGE